MHVIKTFGKKNISDKNISDKKIFRIKNISES